MASNDTELIQHVQRGDMAAFEQLVNRYDEKVLSIAATYVNNEDDAKDIYQEVFIRVFKGLPKFQFRSEFSTWLYRVATNVCLSYNAKRKRHQLVSLSDEGNAQDGQPNNVARSLKDESSADQSAMDSEISSRVHDAIKQLSPQQRLVFTLRHYEGYKLREIADMMDCAEGTVKKYLFTATRRLRGELRGLYL